MTGKEEILEPGFSDFPKMETVVKGPNSTIHDVSTTKNSNESHNSVESSS